MNKRLTIILISLVGVGCLLFGFKLIYKSKKIDNIESIVSDEAIYYLSSYDLSKKINNFAKAPFYQKIINLPLYEKYIGVKFDVSEEKNFSRLGLLDNESALAVFSSQILFSPKNKPSPGTSLGDFVFFTRLDNKKKFKKLIGDFYISFSRQEDSDYSKYKGVRVKRINFSKEKKDKIDLTVYYAFLGDVLLVGNNDTLIKKSIDLYNGDDEKSLLNSRYFHDITNKHSEIKNKALVWLFTNEKNLYKRVMADMEKNSQLDEGLNDQRGFLKNGIKELLKELGEASIGSFSFVDYDNFKQGIFYKKYSYYDDSIKSNEFLDIFRLSGIMEKNIFEFMPLDSISCFGVANNFSKSWKYVKKFVTAVDANMDTNKFLGLDIDKEILPLLGRNIVGVFSDIKEKPFNLSKSQSRGTPFSNFPIPLPELSFLIEMKDITAAKEVMVLISQKIIPRLKKNLEVQEMRETALRVKQGLPKSKKIFASFEVEIENHKGVNINILSSKFEALNINYFNFDKYIIVSSTLDATKKMIDVLNSQYNFLSRYSKNELMEDNLSLPYSYIYIVKLEDIIEKIIQTKIFNMGKMYVPMVSQGKLSGTDINLIVDILKDIPLFMGRQRLLEGDIIENMKYIKIKGLL